jgi:hypothetical protein
VYAAWHLWRRRTACLYMQLHLLEILMMFHSH